MKTITKISIQQNNQRYNIFLDEAFFCGVTEDTLIKLGLKKGMQIDEEALEELIKEETKNKCFNYALYLLGRQNYFEKVLIDKLKQKGYATEDISFTMEKLKQYHYLDDTRLAEAFAKDKKKFSKKGPRYIASALKMKGVQEDTIHQTLKLHYSDEEALENCKEIISKKLDYYKKKTSDPYQLKGKLYALLAQRGFTSSIIKKAIQEVLEIAEEDY